MAQNDIGIDLGTTTIIIAQEGKGVVLNQPSVVAMDTRKKTVLEAGDKALAMVGRTPNYISAIFPLKDGVISDHTMTRELICRFVKPSSRRGEMIFISSSAFMPGLSSASSDAFVPSMTIS